MHHNRGMATKKAWCQLVARSTHWGLRIARYCWNETTQKAHAIYDYIQKCKPLQSCCWSHTGEYNTYPWASPVAPFLTIPVESCEVSMRQNWSVKLRFSKMFVAGAASAALACGEFVILHDCKTYKSFDSAKGNYYVLEHNRVILSVLTFQTRGFLRCENKITMPGTDFQKPLRPFWFMNKHQRQFLPLDRNS